MTTRSQTSHSYTRGCGKPSCFYIWERKKSYKIDKYVHDATKVPDDSSGSEKQAICHNLQIQLNAHEYHKHIFCDLK